MAHSKVRRLCRIGALACSLSFLVPPAAIAVQVLSTEFDQIDFDKQATGFVPCSEYGQVQIVAVPDETEVTYLQVGAALGASPATWVVRNVALPPGNAAAVAAAGIDLRELGITRGTCLASTPVQFEVTPTRSPIDGSPTFTLGGTAIFGTLTDTAEGGVLPGPAAAPTLPPPLPPTPTKFVDGPLVYFNRNGMGNVDVGPNECGPGAVANSMHWLARTDVIDLGAETPEVSLEKLKADMRPAGWGMCSLDNSIACTDDSQCVGAGVCIPPRGVTGEQLIQGKLRFANEAGAELEVHYQADEAVTGTPASVSVIVGPDTLTALRDGDGGRPTFEYLLEQMGRGQDVELFLGWWDPSTNTYPQAHFVVVTQVLQRGSFRQICFSDDLVQDPDHKGGLRTNFCAPVEDSGGFLRLGNLEPNHVISIYAESPPTSDHYLCYSVTDRSQELLPEPPALPQVINLQDQFDQVPEAYAPRSARELCAPASKNGEPIVDAETHLKAYGIRQLVGDHLQPVIEAADQFGTRRLHLIRDDSLLVPTSKAVVNGAPVVPPLPDGTRDGYEHYKCYDVSVRGPRLPRKLLAEVRDQFGFQKVALRRPRRFCVPTSKNGEPIRRPTRHLTCYAVRPLVHHPIPLATVTTNNQFAPELLDVRREMELCVPSLKTVIDP